MKIFLSIIGICTLLISCDSSFETKLIDEPLTDKNFTSEKTENKTSLEISGVLTSTSWFLDIDTKRKLKPADIYQNIIITDSLETYYQTKNGLAKKSDIMINVHSFVVLQDFEIFSKPDLTKKTELHYSPGTLLLISSTSLNDFYLVKAYNEKRWVFIIKKDSQLTKFAQDISFAQRINDIEESNESEFVKEKLRNELQQEEGFNRSEWLPLKGEEASFDEDDEIL
jgi:hypothetical protein